MSASGRQRQEVSERLFGRSPTLVGVSAGGQISTVDDRILPRLRRLRIEINRSGRLEDAACRPARRRRPHRDQRAGALDLPQALIGSGTFQVDVALKGQPPYPTTGRLLLFNGRKGGKPVFLGHVYSSLPFVTSFVITCRAHGRFGTVLTASLPEALGDWGCVTGLRLKLSRRYVYEGTPGQLPQRRLSRPRRASPRSPFPS